MEEVRVGKRERKSDLRVCDIRDWRRKAIEY